MNKLFSCHIGITSGEAQKAAPQNWFQASNGTLLAAIRRDNTVTKPLSIPGRQTSRYTFNDAPTETMDVDSNLQEFSWAYATDFTENTDGTLKITGVTVTPNPYSTDYASLVGKYIISITHLDRNTYENIDLYDLGQVYRVESATSTSLTYKAGNSKTTTERVLASAPDDYGTSYYFRGSVENNYVVFAGMCWRIVRVVGDGSIKLVLYNYNPNSVANPCDASQDGTSNAFARFDGTNISSEFNINKNDNAYIGLMYGTPGSTSYADTHANINKSTILTNLETWYTSKLATYENDLADTIWCNDKSMETVYPYSGQVGYGISDTYYSVYGRIRADGYYETSASPSLMCPNDSNGGKLSKFTANDTVYGNGALDYKIGLLTADEIAYAGATYNGGRTIPESINTGYYLDKNASADWWTLSPYSYNITADMGIVDKSITYDLGHFENCLRAAVSLASSTTIAGGAGTSSNPYVVN